MCRLGGRVGERMQDRKGEAVMTVRRIAIEGGRLPRGASRRTSGRSGGVVCYGFVGVSTCQF